MKIYKKLQQEQILSAVEIGLGILDTKPNVLDVITANGYRREDLDFIKQLCLEAKDKYEGKESKTRDKQGMTKHIEKLLEDLRKEFGFIFDAFQVNYRNDDVTWEKLGLRSRRYVRRNAFLMKARCFFNEVNTDEYLDGLHGYGVSKERLERALELIDRIERAVFRRHKMDGEKRCDRMNRDKLISQVNKLWRTFEKSCRHWFRDTPWVLNGVFDTATLPSRSKRKKAQEPATDDTITKDDTVTTDNTVTTEPAEPAVASAEPTEAPVTFLKGYPLLKKLFRKAMKKENGLSELSKVSEEEHPGVPALKT